MTPDELDRAVTSLRNVGGLYELVALHVENDNRPHVQPREEAMHPRYNDGSTVIYLDDCLAVLRELPDNSVDAVVTDPPYGLSNTDPRHVREALEHWLGGDRAFLPAVGGGGFMGKAWDSFVPPVAVWDECYRVLKPGGHLLSFAGSRTFDLMTLAIRLAGFDIRDSVAWLYGSGFPKSMDMSKAIDKALGAEGTYGEPKSAAHAGWIDRGRMRGEEGEDGWQRPWMKDATAVNNAARKYEGGSEEARAWQGWGTALKPAFEPIVVARKPLAEGTVAANVLAHGVGALNIDATRVGTTGGTRAVFGSEPNRRNVVFGDGMGGNPTDPDFEAGRWPSNVILDEGQAAALDEQAPATGGSGKASGPTLTGASSSVARGTFNRVESTPFYGGDKGGASRFFYVAKAPKSERPVVDGVAHPTVKPLALMRWLIRLVTPPEGIVLEPFAGSGTTVEAAILEDKRVIAIEREADYWPLIRHRIARGNGVEL